MSDINLTLPNTSPNTPPTTAPPTLKDDTPSASQKGTPPAPKEDTTPIPSDLLLQVNQDLNPNFKLSPEERQQFSELATKIDLNHSSSIVRYGYKLQNQLETTIQGSLPLAQRSLSEVGDLFNQMQSAVQGFDHATTSRGLSGLFRSSRRLTTLQTCFTDTFNNLEHIKKQLERQRFTLLVDIDHLEKNIYPQLTKHYKQLTLYLRAGRNHLFSAQDRDPDEILNFTAFQHQLHSLETRLSDLELSRTVCFQSAVQTQLLIHTDRQLVLQIESHLTNSLAIWQQNVATALTVKNSQQVLQRHNSQLIASINAAIELQKTGLDSKSLVLECQPTS